MLVNKDSWKSIILQHVTKVAKCYLIPTRARLMKRTIKRRLEKLCPGFNQMTIACELPFRENHRHINMLIGQHQVLVTEHDTKRPALESHRFIETKRRFGEANDITSTGCY